MFRSSWILLFALLYRQVAGHGQMSRHLVTDDLSLVVVMADAGTTEGPYDEEVEDYVYTSNMTAAATAGSPGVTTDRLSVLDGVPLALTITVYDLSTSSSGYAEECGGVEIFLWHTDTTGVYSAVEQARQSEEGTDGQVWLRAYQTTDADGKVTFNTILPGWYTARTVHYHVRLRYTGSTSWAATSQFLLNDTARQLYSSVSPYTSNTHSQVALARDNIYTGLSSSVRDLLVLQLQGSVETGFTAEMELGLGSTSSAALCSEYVETSVPITSSPTAKRTDNVPTIAPTFVAPSVAPITATPTHLPTPEIVTNPTSVTSAPTTTVVTTTTSAPNGSSSTVAAAEGSTSDGTREGHSFFFGLTLSLTATAMILGIMF